jgi:predicted chitinase
MGRAGAEEEVMQRLRNELRRRQGQVVPEDVNEALDQPYKILRWEKGDYGDVDAIARLDDNTFLSIMFNKGFSQGTKEEAWSVEFYRNNSQEVTGEGDAQRVFATVISAIQTFIKKYKPNKIIFSASKEVEQGQNTESRARLYDSLVQRYARSWGFRAFRADTGNKVIYELSRIKPVAETREKFNQEVMRPGFRWSEEISGITYLVRTQWDNMPEVIARVNNREVGRATFIDHHTRSGLESVSTYVSPKWQGHGIAKNMYAVMRMLGANIQPSATQTAMGKDMWAKWKKAGDTKHLTSMNAKLEQQDMAENFADGQVKGKSSPGRVKRSGASCDGSVTDLRQKAKNASGEKAKMYHWCANMKSGRAKNESEILDDLEEGWKDWVAGAALGAAALSPQAADAKASPQQKPAITQQVQGDAAYATKLILKPEAKILIRTAQAAGMKGKELAQFVAQCAHETANFSSLKELGGRLDFKKYDPKYNPRKAKMLGNKQVGDGAKYHGRGYIQLTGRDNYKRAGQALGLPLEAQPELVEQPDIAAKVAVWFWKNQVAPKVNNFNDTVQVTKPINSGLKGLDDRHNKYASIMALMGSKS